MYSEALKIMDHNTELYMIEEMQKALDEKDAVIAENKAEYDRQLAENKAELEMQLAKIAQLESELATLKQSK